MTKLRDYQQTMLDQIRSHWAAGRKHVLGVLPTGGGKTECAIVLMANATPTERALVIVDRKVLVHQWAERFARCGVDRVGILQGDNTSRIYERILVGTAQTIKARGVPEQVATIVIDESHIWHQTHDLVLSALGEANVLGLTATPLREGLGLRFDTMVIGANIRELIERELLVQPRYFAPRADAIEKALLDVGVRDGDFVNNELSQAMRGKAIMGDVVGEWVKRGGDRQTIGFCVDKAHAADLTAEFLAAGVAAEMVVDDTGDEDRARIFNDFNRGQVRILCSVGVLGVGFDSPIAACAILARPTLSLSLYIQQGGRVLRPAPGKVDAIVLDHAGNSARFGLLEDFVPPEDLSKIDKRTDRKKRGDAPQAWVCCNCEAVNSLALDICNECGTARRRLTSVVVLDGELVEHEHAENESAPGFTIARVHDVYRMMLWYGLSKKLKPEWAYWACRRRFGIDDDTTARKVILWHWRDDAPLVPDEETSRWLKADFQRHMIARRYERAHA